MIIDFLEKYQQELMTERIELKEDIDMLSSKIKENEKFADVLDSTNESYFNSFTPRKLNVRNNEKVLEIKEDLTYLQQDKSAMDERMIFLDGRISEIEDLLIQVKEQKNNKSETMVSQEDEESASSILNSDLIKKQITNIIGYIIADPMRAKISLEELMHNI